MTDASQEASSGWRLFERCLEAAKARDHYHGGDGSCCQLSDVAAVIDYFESLGVPTSALEHGHMEEGVKGAKVVNDLWTECWRIVPDSATGEASE